MSQDGAQVASLDAAPPCTIHVGDSQFKRQMGRCRGHARSSILEGAATQRRVVALLFLFRCGMQPRGCGLSGLRRLRTGVTGQLLCTVASPNAFCRVRCSCILWAAPTRVCVGPLLPRRALYAWLSSHYAGPPCVAVGCRRLSFVWWRAGLVSMEGLPPNGAFPMMVCSTTCAQSANTVHK